MPGALRSREDVTLARSLRRSCTPAERVLWAALRGRRFAGLKFRRQHPIGALVADFCCVAQALVIELDGPVHLRTRARDAERTEMLNLCGYRVMRFTNERVFSDLDGVLAEIAAACGVGDEG